MSATECAGRPDLALRVVDRVGGKILPRYFCQQFAPEVFGFCDTPRIRHADCQASSSSHSPNSVAVRRCLRESLSQMFFARMWITSVITDRAEQADTGQFLAFEESIYRLCSQKL